MVVACAQGYAAVVTRLGLPRNVRVERHATSAVLFNAAGTMEVAAMFKRRALACSFCGKGAAQVTKLVAGPKVYICDR